MASRPGRRITIRELAEHTGGSGEIPAYKAPGKRARAGEETDAEEGADKAESSAETEVDPSQDGAAGDRKSVV